MVWVASAGPAMNIALAILAALGRHGAGGCARWERESREPPRLVYPE
jgi:hypothetical protein